jgi:ferrous iron transport protein A
MQLSFNSGTAASPCPALVAGKPATANHCVKLAELRHGESAVVVDIDLPTEMAQRLMELGFIPGTRVEAARSAPGGDPRVFRVDGTEIALRRETATHVTVRR